MRTVTEGDTVLFCGSDVAKALGYDVPQKALRDHCSSVLKRNITTESRNRYGSFTRRMEMIFIPESDHYRLVTHSKLPDAQKFERWVFEEVLPSIRKHGSYITKLEQKALLLIGAMYYGFSKLKGCEISESYSR